MERTTYVSFELNIFRFWYVARAKLSPRAQTPKIQIAQLQKEEKKVHRKAEKKS